MKQFLIILLCFALLIPLTVAVGAEDSSAAGGLADQAGVVNYVDEAQSLNAPDCGFASSSNGAWLYPGPNKTSIANPTSYSFLNICLGRYSGQRRDDGKDIPLDESFYESLRATLANAYANGVMVGIRFQYDTDGKQQMEPEWDMLIQHFVDIRNSGILDEYADIIVWCELGTLGAFGEQWGTRYGDLGYSDELIDLYLTLFREDIPILLRTTGRITNWVNAKLGTKYNANNIDKMVDEVATVYGDRVNNVSGYYSKDGKDFSTGNLIKDDLSRLGLYNDGYMGTNYDYGTYKNRKAETKFLNDQNNVVYGGEYSGDHFLQIVYGNSYTDVWWPINMVPEMYYTNLSYLHGGPWSEKKESHTFADQASADKFISQLEHVYEQIGATWLSGTQVTETANGKYTVTYTAPGFDTLPMTAQIAQAVTEKNGVTLDLSEYYDINVRKFVLDHMGYRFVVRSSRLTGGALRPGDSMQIDLAVENTGFHKITKPKEVEVLLVRGDQVFATAINAVDVRTWDTGINRLLTSVDLPAAITGGEWEVYLRISPENTDAADDAKYGVKFANPEIYRADLGANLIGKITVDAHDAAISEGYTDPRPAGDYIDTPTTYAADTPYLNYMPHAFKFTTSGLYGFTVMFRVDGIAEGSEISISRWETNGSGSQLHSFNYFFARGTTTDESGNTVKQYGQVFKQNGYYLMYCPLFSIGATRGPTIAGTTQYTYFYSNSVGTAREDKNCPPELNGNAATITPLGVVEGATTAYDITFHYNGEENHTGVYDFKNTDRVASESVQFRQGVRLLDLYEGEQPAAFTEDGITYRFVGWTTVNGYRQGLVVDDQIAIGTLDLYPYYEIDLGATALNARVVTLTDGRDAAGVIYTLDPATRTAFVGDGSGWTGNAGFSESVGDDCIIPAYVEQDGVLYTVTGIGAFAFASGALRNIYLPMSVTAIAQDAFRGITGQVRIHTYEGGSAHNYAQKNGINCSVPAERGAFAVAFRDEDGVVAVQAVKAGEGITNLPCLDDLEDFLFEGWGDTKGDAVDVSAVRSDLTLYAQYSVKPDRCCVTFMDGDRVVARPTVPYGAALTDIPARPDRPTDDYTDYIFEGWYNAEGESLDYSSIKENVTLYAIFTERFNPGKFDDINMNAWYVTNGAVHYALRTKLMQGKSETKFYPDAVMTRAEFATVLWRMEGEPSANSLPVPTQSDYKSGKWWAQAMRWAVGNGIINGNNINGKILLDADGTITRLQMVTMLYRYAAQVKDYDMTVEDGMKVDFVDIAAVNYSQDEFRWAVNCGYISGTAGEGGTWFYPSNGMTRAQAITILQRFLEDRN